ncbi:MFS transporter [Siminovitchia acidinfaciens]|uniref:MFS transporter n=1 Tax=Siminovitchia acidinfaciens TaxID=2321395 RepID=A0A429XV90_9BACI|nr:MFS transporter [Siminovitchia acidinfaciens]RST72083.1 MFS transporter [Siminovitchia acidinfaciens]VEF46195.1 major facilitator superfamily protein [Bacillus freudenreichii]
MSTEINHDNLTEKERKSMARRAGLASLVGTTIEWYDFFLFGTMAALVFPQLFFPGADPVAGLLQSFAALFVGFAARPLGAAFFGYFGDRIGRKATLVTTLLLMGIASTLIGLLPSYETWGVAATILLVFFRFCQGFGAGGEWGGSVVLSVEWSSKGKRGLMGSMTQVASPIALLLSSAVVSATIFLTGDNFHVWGWRIPFLISIILVIIGFIIRRGVEDSPSFKKMQKEDRLSKQPVRDVFRRYPKTLFLVILAGLAQGVPFYVFTTFAISYGSGQLQLESQFLTNTLMVVSIVEIAVIFYAAHLSDKYNRKSIFYVGALITVLMAFPFFWLFDTKVAGLVVLAMSLAIIGAGTVYGPLAALIAECFPAELRYSGTSLGYQLSAAIQGISPMLCVYLLDTFNSTAPISIYLVVASLIAIVAVVNLKKAKYMDAEDVAS